MLIVVSATSGVVILVIIVVLVMCCKLRANRDHRSPKEKEFSADIMPEVSPLTFRCAPIYLNILANKTKRIELVIPTSIIYILVHTNYEQVFYVRTYGPKKYAFIIFIIPVFYS